MAVMDFYVGNTLRGQVLNYKRKFEAQKLVSKALDGTSYAQSLGNAITRYEVHVYCATETNRNALDSACNECDEVSIILRSGSEIKGFIEDEEIVWKEWTDGHGVGKFTLIKE